MSLQMSECSNVLQKMYNHCRKNFSEMTYNTSYCIIKFNHSLTVSQILAKIKQDSGSDNTIDVRNGGNL